jgi:aerobic-type carbon monoxide dehydrogenase small subunit (CoxS/CutS family)
MTRVKTTVDGVVYVTTIQGLANGEWHPVQQAFHELTSAVNRTIGVTWLGS